MGAILAEVARRDNKGRNIADTLDTKASTSSPDFNGTVTINDLLKFTGSSGIKGIQFGTLNKQITNIECGIANITVPARPSNNNYYGNVQITLKQPNFGSGTWHFFAFISGNYSSEIIVSTNTHSNSGFNIEALRTKYSGGTETSYEVYWLAVKYY